MVLAPDLSLTVGGTGFFASLVFCTRFVTPFVFFLSSLIICVTRVFFMTAPALVLHDKVSKTQKCDLTVLCPLLWRCSKWD